MTVDAEEAAVRNVVAIAIAEPVEANGRGVDALLGQKQSEVLVGLGPTRTAVLTRQERRRTRVQGRAATRFNHRGLGLITA
jgi:hypothetical protein